MKLLLTFRIKFTKVGQKYLPGVQRNTFGEEFSVKKIKLLFFRVWTEECLTSVRTFCQRWQPWIPCAQETNMNHRFFSEKFVIFYSSLYSEGKLCCFWRKLFGRFEFPEENLEKNMLGEVFFISNLLENQQLFYSVLEKKFHQFRQLCILRLQWTIWGRKSFWKKNNFFFCFGRWGETFAACCKMFPTDY